ncbi:MAG TPA: TonB-dependent receptor [Chitinophagales bacterium]|nr:TonB-dependent receptor [Chitinophagales bacterium]
MGLICLKGFERVTKKLLLVLILISSIQLSAQEFSISGKIYDATNQEDLIGANIVLLQSKDSIQIKGTSSDIDGSFLLQNVNAGKYILKISFIGFSTVFKNLQLINNDLKNINIELREDANVLKEVEVSAILPRMILKGDTVQLNADAFKVHSDADASDLVTKMPGVMMLDGKIQAQGEEVKKVLLDGKEFFGDDALMTLKNLPAEIIDKVQIYDNVSDQAKFSGFNDGNTEKTINIVTKGEVKDGFFGRAYIGYGTDNRFSAGGNLNYFKDSRRISFVGLSNNINQQNFNSEDLIGVASSTQAKSRGTSRGRGGPSRGSFSGNNVNNFLSMDQGGINLTNGIGINYVEEWKDKVKLSASYFYNRTQNDNTSIIDRQYLTEDFNQIYHQEGVATSLNNNHRFNAKLDYDIDDKKSISIKPNLSFQGNEANTLINAISSWSDETILSKSNNDNNVFNKALSFSNTFLYKQKFDLKGRTFSASLSTSYNNRNLDNYLKAENYYTENLDSLILLDQWTDGLSKSYTIGGELNYTEPINEFNRLKLSYEPTYSKSSSDRFTYQYNELTNNYSIQDIGLSNVFDNANVNHNLGTAYNYEKDKIEIKLGANYQYSSLLSDRTYPNEIQVDKTYHNFLPTAQVQYKFSRGNNINLFYRTNVRAPSVNQLQDVVDNTNPLILSSGNKDLNQQYSHLLGLRWRYTQPAKGNSAFIYLGGGLNNNYISNSTLLVIRDTLIANDILLPAGGQYTRPVNLNGNWNFRSFVNYGTPLLFMKSNMNINAGFTYNRVPNLVNELLQYNNTFNTNAGIFIGSNISQKIDFRVGYQANYNIVKYSQNSLSNNNYYTGVASLGVNVMPWKGLNIQTDLNFNHYSGLTKEYNQNYTLWNAAVGYKFLKNKAAEFKVQVFDILGVNNSISRSVTESYVQDSRTDVLDRYFMLQFTYKFNKFNTKAAQ